MRNTHRKYPVICSHHLSLWQGEKIPQNLKTHKTPNSLISLQPKGNLNSHPGCPAQDTALWSVLLSQGAKVLPMSVTDAPDLINEVSKWPWSEEMLFVCTKAGHKYQSSPCASSCFFTSKPKAGCTFPLSFPVFLHSRQQKIWADST